MKMDSTMESSLTISTQETPLLLQSDPPTQPRIKNLKTKLLFLLRILLVLIAGFLILYSIYATNRKKPEPRSSYLSGLARYYCHLTPYHNLCYDSMSSAADATAIESDPALIFATSLQLVASQLNRTASSVDKALSILPASDASQAGTGLRTCRDLIGDSLSRLDRSLGMLGIDLFFFEERIITDEIMAVKNNGDGCLSALNGVDDGAGVEELKLGVEIAIRLLVNFKSLFKRRGSVLNDFSNPPNYYKEEHYNYLYNYYFHFVDFYYGFDYGFMFCLYGAMYVFVALLYFLLWQ